MSQLLITVGQFIGSHEQMMQFAFMAGAATLGALFPPTSKQVGPRLSDLNVQLSTYGIAKPRGWGGVRVAGNVIAKTNLIEHKTVHTSGGKGKSPKVQQTLYTYTVSLAVSFGDGPAAGIKRMWFDKALVYDVTGGTGTLWTPNTVKAIGDQIVDGQNNIQQVVTVTDDAKTASYYPTWNEHDGGLTYDNHVTWANQGKTGILPRWGPNQRMELGEQIVEIGRGH